MSANRKVTWVLRGLAVAAVLAAIFLSKGCVPAKPCSTVAFIIMSPYTGLPIPVEIQKGEWDLPEEKRGYKIWGSLEELQKDVQEMMEKQSL